ncbi:MAG: hypothetical protein KJ887_02235 [Candidatus Omnitrophica bacterium]|nr:hypothetical protein [Candidatus Omnitrophota bacterium]MBU1047881.1 hypothetical protein [Candidatus Omnitrophota bacterium]MBU1630593.1 hypothetical protein [Candidatus Omnitrophota bacterium]MBU1766568.1 hypothetical protein [Candidatus Omnitrophota bacterium]MBU1888504.1 hypothetical protein [Candidatus Omnitrophota bacterium]
MDKNRKFFKKEALFILLLLITITSSGCSSSKRDDSESGIDNLITKVNADDKSFKGVWIYKGAKIIGGKENKINISISGKKFNINDRWLYDDATFYDIDKKEKLAKWKKWKWSGRQLPFWKMPVSMNPFGAPVQVSEDKVAGRDCIVCKIGGTRDRVEVSLKYWIDKEKNVLLKKEHIIGPENDPFFKESYECESIEYNPVFSEDTFTPEIPASYVRVKKAFLDCELLDNKF